MPAPGVVCFTSPMGIGKRFNNYVVNAGTGSVLLWFLIASAIVVLLASAAGFYDYNIDDEAHINREYRPAAGDRRY